MVSSEEFHISVTPVGQNDYLVRTEQVAPGVPLAEELVTWPVAEWLTAAGHLMNDPLKSVLQGDAIARNSVNLVELGQQFYNALFQGTLRDSWITAQGIAQNQQQVLRLRLGLKDTRLARLPWEVMHAGDRPLATGPYITFSRYQSGILTASRLQSRNFPTPQESGGVKVLMVIASPTDQVRLEQKQEAIKLQAELHRPISRAGEGKHHLPEIELTILDQPGREELTQALEQGRFHVLHYSGHSNLGPNGGEIYLVSNRTGLTETLSGDDLAGLLVNNNIQMAVFNSCLGAYRANSDASGDSGERNLTESLVKRGLRGVLAMSERIPDEVALTLTQLFYRNLSQGYPLDLCVSRVRQGLISAYGSHQMYWALPILYLQREFEGFLSPENTLVASVELLNSYQSTLQPNPAAMYSAVSDDSELPLDMEAMISSNLARDSAEVDWLGEETWGDLVDEIEYDDPSYDEDCAIVSDLFRQLDQQIAITEEPPLMGELVQQVRENGLQERQVSEEMAVLEEELGLRREVPTRSSQAPENFSTDWQSPRLPTSPPAPVGHGSDRQKLQILGVVGVSAIAILLGVNWWWQSRSWSPLSDIPQIPTESLVNPQRPPIDLKTAPTGIVTATATEKMSQGDLQPGLEAVKELLSRGALASAQTALDLVVERQADDPAVNFMRGRLAWQLVQIGDKKYSIDDARRYWEIAVRDQPDSLEYINALGFAYYAEGNLNRANDSWFKALNLALKPQNMASSAPVALKKIVPKDALTSYAGLALGLYKSANNQPGAKRAQYITEAIKLRQLVIQDNPVDFQVDKLAHNWLWTEKAITDWRSLLQEKSK
ncbi:cell division protein HetF [Cylindrospermum sp. FACHB-282]|uniref:cell division protein HetF n=1 Tax=Cylindrospermum sp. FACHB-282 TaxID=2692794 RepID=UPI001682D179|nr:cell division protein HetF [Cylindrospermum sp. FACHB-282]MBD2385824.1 CHAT domain-containing protein [Cylindrospermum sp. FACHB-282]